MDHSLSFLIPVEYWKKIDLLGIDLSESLEFIEGELFIARQMQHYVLESTSMSIAENKPITIPLEGSNVRNEKNKQTINSERKNRYLHRSV